MHSEQTPRRGRRPAATTAEDRPARPRPTATRQRSQGWVPTEHGAWGMIFLPPATALTLGEHSWVQIPVIATWVLGYFAFFALTAWWKSRRKPRYRRAVATYAALTALGGLVVLLGSPRLLYWALPFAPCVVVAVVAVWRRHERDLPSRLATIAAACLMLPVVVDAGATGLAPSGMAGIPPVHADAPWWPTVWGATVVFAAYFSSTVPYVKTLIRNRGSRSWERLSLVWHGGALLIVAAVAAASFGDRSTVPIRLDGPGWAAGALVVVFLGLVIRSWAMPARARHRGTPWPPKVVGQAELVVAITLFVLLIIAVG